MKKTIIPCIIACTLTISTNSLGMLTQTSRITHAKKFIVPHRKFHITPQQAHAEWDERIEIEDMHEKYLLNNPEFLKKVHHKQLAEYTALLERQLKISQENNMLLQKTSAQLEVIQKQLEKPVVQYKDKDCNRDNAFDLLRAENEQHLKRHRDHGGFDSSSPYPYKNYDDYLKYSSY